MKPHRGTLILVLGVLSLLMCQPLGIFAWVMGGSDLKAMAAGTMDPSGKDLTNIGRILGIIATVLLILGILGVTIMFALGLAGAVLGSGPAQ